jgi:hypothetical protein
VHRSEETSRDTSGKKWEEALGITDVTLMIIGMEITETL